MPRIWPGCCIWARSWTSLIPTVAQEAARDLVRAREDCRGDVMTSRHRISKLLLRQGIVYYGGQAWTGKHEMWLRAQRFDSSALMLAYESALDAMVAGVHRRDRLDEAITAMAADSSCSPVVTRLGCLRGVSTLTAFGLAVEIGDWHRLTGRWIGAYLGLVPCSTPRAQHGSRVGSPRPATAMPGVCWSKRLASPQHLSARTRPAAPLDAATVAARQGGMPTTIGCTPGGPASISARTPGGRQRRDRP